MAPNNKIPNHRLLIHPNHPSDKLVVRCDKCGKERQTRFWTPGDTHKACGGKFNAIRVA